MRQHNDEVAERTIKWYAWMCYVNAAMNLLVGAFCLYEVSIAGQLAAVPEVSQQGVDAAMIRMIFLPFAAIGIVFGVLNLFLPRMPRTRSWHTAHLINIVLGLGSCCLTIPCLFLLLAWVKPEVRQAFDN